MEMAELLPPGGVHILSKNEHDFFFFLYARLVTGCTCIM